MARHLRGILFDLGDTLLDFGQLDATKLFRAGARRVYLYLRRLDMPLPGFRKYFRRQIFAVRWNYLKSRLTGREFNSLDLIDRLARRMGHDLSREQMLELAGLWYEPLERCATVAPGLPEMLAGLRRRGLTLGVVSNTFVPPAVLDGHLQREGLLEHLAVRVYSSEVGFRKPSRRIFAVALQRAGLEPCETMFVGDSPFADIRGARRMGMVTVLKDPSDRHGRRVRADHRIRSILQLPRVVAGYDEEASG